MLSSVKRITAYMRNDLLRAKPVKFRKKKFNLNEIYNCVLHEIS